MKAFIFAAGLGTRLRPLTLDRPKALVEVGGKTMLERTITTLKDAGFSDFVVNVHHFADKIESYLAENDNFGCNISISDERALLLDTGGAVAAARRLLGDEPFLVHNVDIMSNLDIRGFVDEGLDGALARLVVSDRPSSRKLLFDEDDCLCGWLNTKTGEVRGPAAETPEIVRNILAFSGIHMISPEVFDLMAGWPAKFSIIDFYLATCATHRIVSHVPANFKLQDMGTPEAVAEKSKELAGLQK
ncbi:MAG: nucleotidyltransferase family protein [Bacteroidales bacterium]|nr:nucleotidyltransferase family protein [Bacteroidales bacterium]